MPQSTPTLRCWQIEATIPYKSSDNREYNKNFNLTVAAFTLEGAIKTTRDKYPTIRFLKVMCNREMADFLISGE